MVENSAHSHLETLLDDAQAYLDAGEIDRAIAVLQEAYKIDPRNLRACSLLGFCALHKSKLDDAKKYFSFVLRMDPDNASARIGLKRVADHMAEPPAHPREVQVERPLPPPAPAGPPADNQSKPRFAKRLGVYASTIVISAIAGVGAAWGCLLIFLNVLFPRTSDSRADDVFAGFFLLIAFCVSIWFGTRTAHSKLARHTEAKAPKNTRSVRQATQQPIMQQAIASRNTSTVNYVIAALLWLPLIALSGYLGGLIGNEISGGGGGAIVGGVVGVIGVQAIYVGLFPRRR